MSSTHVCDECESADDVGPKYDWWGRVYGYQCDGCAEAAWERHCTDYDATGATERLELDHKAKRETR